MEPKAVIVSGEAPESDEELIAEKTGVGFPELLASNSCGTIIQGEAHESDDDENASVNSASIAIDPMNCSYVDHKRNKIEKSCIKYNSLLHKKLRECNKSLEKNISEFLTLNINTANEELLSTNKQIVKSELILQECMSKMQSSCDQFEDVVNSLMQIIEEDYFNAIKL